MVIGEGGISKWGNADSAVTPPKFNYAPLCMPIASCFPRPASELCTLHFHGNTKEIQFFDQRTALIIMHPPPAGEVTYLQLWTCRLLWGVQGCFFCWPRDSRVSGQQREKN